MLDFYEENSHIDFDYWELKFWEAYGYYPWFPEEPFWEGTFLELDGRRLAIVGDDRAEFLAFVREESDNPDHPYPEGA